MKPWGEEKEERIINLTFSILAHMLQTLAIETYGNDGPAAIRKVMEEIYNKPSVKAEMGRLRNTIEKALLSALPKEQCDLIMTEVIDEIPRLLVEWVTELYAPYRLLPLTEAQSIATTLADMMQETDNADG